MKKFLVTALIASIVVIFLPKSVNAAALNEAINFNSMQANYLNATRAYYNTYEVPVLNVYSQAMSNQMSQALAANFQAQIMAQQAAQRAAVNSFQLGMNYNTYMTNINTQYQNLMNTSMYNYQNMMNTGYANYMENVNKAYGMMMGQALFPQAQ